MTRIALGVEYCGAAYQGWQKQPKTEKTIQSVLETALTKLADEPIDIVCAGRTDAGVHANAQVIHFDTNAKRSNYAWVVGTNSYLPDDIRIAWAKPVPDDFHARFSARTRTYDYFIDNSAIHSPFTKKTITWHGVPLNLALMQEAGQYLVGEHDFSAYRASSCQSKQTVRNLSHLQLTQNGRIIRLTVTANAFLHHMIRNIVGVLLKVGEGKAEPIWAKEVLDSKIRSKGGNTAKSHGLYLSNVEYDSLYKLPKARSTLLLEHI